MDGFTNPENNIEQLSLREGQKVADFGAGTGFYTFAAAKRVGESGRVYCLEIQQDLLKRVQQESIKRGLNNIEFMWADLEALGGSKLSDGKVDAVIIANLLFQIEDKATFLKEAARILRPGGRLLAVDWSDSFSGLGPAADVVVTKASAMSLFSDNGFEMVREFNAGAHHWGLIFKK